MTRRLSRRPGPGHPMLFVDGSDIPEPVRPPRPRAADAMGPFTAVLAAADATPLGELDGRSAGRTVRVGGERRPPEAMLAGDALLDDGTAVLPLALPACAPRSLRAALGSRFLLVTGIVRELEGALVIDVDEVADLRALARDWAGRR